MVLRNPQLPYPQHIATKLPAAAMIKVGETETLRGAPRRLLAWPMRQLLATSCDCGTGLATPFYKKCDRGVTGCC